MPSSDKEMNYLIYLSNHTPGRSKNDRLFYLTLGPSEMPKAYGKQYKNPSNNHSTISIASICFLYQNLHYKENSFIRFQYTFFSPSTTGPF